MTPRQKAYSLVNKIRNIEDDNTYISISLGKKLALIAVDEIILEREVMYASVGINPGKFWHEVKEELNKM